MGAVNSINDIPATPETPADIVHERGKLDPRYRVGFEPMTFRQMCRLVKEDWVAHGWDWTKPGFRAVANHRFGNWRMNLRWKILRAPFSLLYRRWYRKIRACGIELSYTTKLGRRTVIEHQGGIVIHGNSIIGNDCVLRQGVTLGIKSMDRPFDAPVLGDRVEVGAGAKILGAVRIGDGAKIGANAVVLCDVPAGATAVGIPARVVGEKKRKAENSNDETRMTNQ